MSVALIAHLTKALIAARAGDYVQVLKLIEAAQYRAALLAVGAK